MNTDKRNYTEVDYNGESLSEGQQQRIVIKPSKKFLDFLAGDPVQRGGLVEEFFNACFNEYDGEVHRMVKELLQEHPELDTPLGRFNAGQAFMIRLTGILQQLLNERLADYINHATVEFVATTKSREATQRSRLTGMSGIG